MVSIKYFWLIIFCIQLCIFVLAFLFNGILTFMSYLKAKTIFLKAQSWYYLTYSLRDKGVHANTTGTYPKVNLLSWLEFVLACYIITVQQDIHYATETPLLYYAFKQLTIKIIRKQT